MRPDVVIVATGSKARPAPFCGGDGKVVHDAYDLLMGEDSWLSGLADGPVLVYGGGETGCETAEYLALRGRQVLLVSRSPAKALARSAEFVYRHVLLARMAANPLIEILSETELAAVSVNTAELRAGDGTVRYETVAAVVVAQGREPNGDLVPQLRALGIPAHAIGDAVKGGRIGDAVQDAYAVVRKIATRHGEPVELAC
jgi:pyruvate/2-oxoglutarate dehydrogenase complex dihydrolipoamide dehydrogenase (E3) component